MFARALSVFCVLAFSANTVRAGDKPPADEDVKKAQTRVEEFLKGIEGAAAGRVNPLTSDGVAATFPNHILFTVTFPQFPLARVVPAPLKSANVVAVPKKDGKPVAITDTKELEKFFKENAAAVKTGPNAEDAVKAWLRAAAELNQDGFYKFTVKADKATVASDGITVGGQAPVDTQGGNKGDVKATLTFKDGKLASADTKVALTPGIRPICQATKLLDADPIVRGMAEQSIRVMGSSAKPYLDEQRAKASPELKAAIDRIWQKILDEGR